MCLIKRADSRRIHHPGVQRQPVCVAECIVQSDTKPGGSVGRLVNQTPVFQIKSSAVEGWHQVQGLLLFRRKFDPANSQFRRNEIGETGLQTKPPLIFSRLSGVGQPSPVQIGHVAHRRCLQITQGKRFPDVANLQFRNGSGRFYTRVGSIVAAVGVAEIRRSDGSGTPHGHVLMARAIGAHRLAGLLHVGARIDPVSGDRVTVVPDRRTTRITVPMPGADGHAVAAVRFAVSREVALLGRRVLLLAVAGSTLLLLIMLLVLRQAIARMVLAPLARVEGHMQRVRASGSLALPVEKALDDEIGSLGRSFNAMLSQLRDLREQIEAQSFALGRSESAVAMMHNVHNALTPISTILGQGIAHGPAIDTSCA
ncbi:MAG: HAMP domain-containing protein [Lysobacteraceae bacterium]|nr:MAG: HAMP domain-containing protein [Xanthomonadaceae bacterium]